MLRVGLLTPAGGADGCAPKCRATRSLCHKAGTAALPRVASGPSARDTLCKPAVAGPRQRLSPEAACVPTRALRGRVPGPPRPVRSQHSGQAAGPPSRRPRAGRLKHQAVRTLPEAEVPEGCPRGVRSRAQRLDPAPAPAPASGRLAAVACRRLTRLCLPSCGSVLAHGCAASTSCPPRAQPRDQGHLLQDARTSRP